MSWITGSASWLYRCIVEYVLGIRADFDGLRVDPCLPSHWDGIRVRRRFRGAFYNITIWNPDHLQKGEVLIHVDGEPIEGNVIRSDAQGTEHEVRVDIR
jgi:cellobiose phosphorylase